MNNFLIKYLGESLYWLVSICTGYIGIVPLMAKPGQIINRSYRWYRKIRPLGLTIVVASVLGIYFNNLQNIYNDNKATEKEKKFKNSLDSSYNVSLNSIKNKFDDSNEKIVSTVINSLGQYGFKLDSANSKLVKVVRDSSKTRVIMPDNPVLTLCADIGIRISDDKTKMQVGKVRYDLIFCSLDAGSTDFDLVFETAVSDSLNNLEYTGRIKALEEDRILPKEGGYISGIQVDNSLNFETIYIFIKGTYKDTNKLKTFPMNDIYYFNKKNKQFGLLSLDAKKKVVDFINSSNRTQGVSK